MTPAQVQQLQRIAQVLLPGDGQAPPASSVPDLDQLMARAVDAIGVEGQVVMAALAQLEAEPTWDELRAYAEDHVDDFEVLSTVVSGAYFMSPQALDAIGYPHGQERRAARIDLAADQLSSGVLDAIAERDSMVRLVP